MGFLIPNRRTKTAPGKCGRLFGRLGLAAVVLLFFMALLGGALTPRRDAPSGRDDARQDSLLVLATQYLRSAEVQTGELRSIRRWTAYADEEAVPAAYAGYGKAERKCLALADMLEMSISGAAVRRMSYEVAKRTAGEGKDALDSLRLHWLRRLQGPVPDEEAVAELAREYAEGLKEMHRMEEQGAETLVYNVRFKGDRARYRAYFAVPAGEYALRFVALKPLNYYEVQ